MEKENKRILYHGSSAKLIGNKLIPKQGYSAKNKAGNQFAVYATDRKDFAIVIAILHQEGVGPCRLNFPNDKAIGTVYVGWPSQEHFYLYTLDSSGFVYVNGTKGEWASSEKVTPINIERLKTKDYSHLLRKGTDREYEKYKELVKRFKERNKK